jgi:hypothetical protein
MELWQESKSFGFKCLSYWTAELWRYYPFLIREVASYLLVGAIDSGLTAPCLRAGSENSYSLYCFSSTRGSQVESWLVSGALRL